MARKCKITGKKPLAGNSVSHANNKKRRLQKPNIVEKRIFDPELGTTVRVKLSTSALRTVTKKGLAAYLRKKGLKVKDIR